MPALCFHCDVELVERAKFCHQCGAPTFRAEKAAEAVAGVTAEARARIKQDVRAAAQMPAATRMVGTVLLPRLRKAPSPGTPSPWRRFFGARVWRRPALWGALAAAVFVAVGLALIGDVQDWAQQQTGYYRIITRLSAACWKDSRSQVEAYVARIRDASGERYSLLESAMLFDYVVRGLSVQQGDCSKIIEVLSRPDRFERLVQ